MKKNNILLNIALIISILAVIGLSFFAYTKNQSRQVIAKSAAEINMHSAKFSNEKDINKKIDELKSLIEEEKIYKGQVKEIKSLYESSINDMRNKLVVKVNSLIKENKIENFDVNKDKDKITTAQKNLEDLLNTIKNNKDIIYTDDSKFENSKKEIEELLTKYGAKPEEKKEEITEVKEETPVATEQEQTNQQAVQTPAANTTQTAPVVTNPQTTPRAVTPVTPTTPNTANNTNG